MSQKLPANKCEWILLNLIKIFDKGYFFEVDVQYPEKLHEPHNELSFLAQRIKLERVEKLHNLHDKNEHAIHKRNLKQTLSHGLILQKVHRMIKFNEKALPKPSIDMNSKRRQKAKANKTSSS